MLESVNSARKQQPAISQRGCRVDVVGRGAKAGWG